MSPASVITVRLGPPSHPAPYQARLDCDEHPDWCLTWTAATPLAHLANLAELEDMAVEHNTAHHGREDSGTTDTTQRHEREEAAHGFEDQRRATDLP